MNDDEDLCRELREAVERQRPYAGFDDWHDREIRDRGLGTDFATALGEQFGIELPRIQVTPKGEDPPDLRAGNTGIELTELVDGDLIAAAVQEKEAGLHPTQYRSWTRPQFHDRLRELIERKDGAEPDRSWPDYWLVIHTDEPGLTPEIVESLLEGWRARPCRLLTRAFLLMSYFPSHEGRPLFELPLDPAGNL